MAVTAVTAVTEVTEAMAAMAATEVTGAGDRMSETNAIRRWVFEPNAA
jgi:hypothetical protein